jgi:hypothetical protein
VKFCPKRRIQNSKFKNEMLLEAFNPQNVKKEKV